MAQELGQLPISRHAGVHGVMQALGYEGSQKVPTFSPPVKRLICDRGNTPHSSRIWVVTIPRLSTDPSLPPEEQKNLIRPNQTILWITKDTENVGRKSPWMDISPSFSSPLASRVDHGRPRPSASMAQTRALPYRLGGAQREQVTWLCSLPQAPPQVKQGGVKRWSRKRNGK